MPALDANPVSFSCKYIKLPNDNWSCPWIEHPKRRTPWFDDKSGDLDGTLLKGLALGLGGTPGGAAGSSGGRVSTGWRLCSWGDSRSVLTAAWPTRQWSRHLNLFHSTLQKGGQEARPCARSNWYFYSCLGYRVVGMTVSLLESM